MGYHTQYSNPCHSSLDGHYYCASPISMLIFNVKLSSSKRTGDDSDSQRIAQSDIICSVFRRLADQLLEQNIFHVN